jgi:GR25 family glycosyltransferase involved in LPS biosynthesis
MYLTKIFIIHYTPLGDRKKFMDEQMKKQGIEATYILEKDRDVLTEEELKIFDTKRAANGKFPLNLAECSVALKHFEAYKRIVEEGIDHALILEDDVSFLVDNFEEKMTEYFYQLPDDWDMFFVGCGWNLHIPQFVLDENPDRNVFLKGNKGTGKPEMEATGWPICGGSTRCLDAYMITNSCAQKIVNIVDRYYKGTGKIARPVDIWLNQQIEHNNYNVYWGEPNLLRQGSERGGPKDFKSSIKTCTDYKK